MCRMYCSDYQGITKVLQKEWFDNAIVNSLFWYLEWAMCPFRKYRQLKVKLPRTGLSHRIIAETLYKVFQTEISVKTNSIFKLSIDTAERNTNQHVTLMEPQSK